MAARFFCDNCGTEVKRNTGRCPRCGRYFASVKCPQCGFTGEESLFAGGCPVCGYCVPTEPGKQTPRPEGSRRELIAAGKLPLWVYAVSAAALLAVGAALFFAFRLPRRRRRRGKFCNMYRFFFLFSSSPSW